MDKLIINFTPTGMVPVKANNTYVPISPSEIIEQVHEAGEMGITLVHLHARDDKEKPTYKATIYDQIISGIRKHVPQMVIGVSLSGRNFNEFEKRSEVLSLKPDMGSLTLSSLNFANQASMNDPDMIKDLALTMKQNGVTPELEVFDLGMVNYSKYLIERKMLMGPLYYNIILGNIAGAQADFLSIGALLNSLPQEAIWALGGIGRNQLKSNALAVVMGGGVRIGLEDNIYFDRDRKILATNKNLIRRIHELAEIHERSIMTPEEFGNLGFYNVMA